MALVNALLVRYATGYTWVEDAGSITTHGRREGFLSLGAATGAAEAERTAQAVLDQRSSPQVAVSVGMEPAGSDEPYADFDVADDINGIDEAGSPASMRVMALTVSEDDEGNPIFVPELQTLAQALDQRLAQALKAMSNGSLGGSTLTASPAPLTGAGVSSDPTGSWSGSGVSGSTGGAGSVDVVTDRLVALNFSFGGQDSSPLTVGTHADVPAPVDLELVSVTPSASTAGSTNSVFDVLLNGSSAGGVTLSSGATETTDDVSGQATAFTGKIAVECTTAGTGALGVNVLVVAKVLA